MYSQEFIDSELIIVYSSLHKQSIGVSEYLNSITTIPGITQIIYALFLEDEEDEDGDEDEGSYCKKVASKSIKLITKEKRHEFAFGKLIVQS